MDPAMHGGHGRRSDPPPPSTPRTPPPPSDITTSKRLARTVFSLTQEQVRKKRETDRVAQRAVRERTKMRIHVLEEEVLELKAELREFERSKETEFQALIDDNRALRSQIQRLTQLARPLVSLLASETENAGDGVDAHRPPGNANDHGGYDMGNIAQDVDMGVEARAGMPQSVGFSSSGDDYLARGGRLLSSTTRPPREDIRCGGMTTDGSHGPDITHYNAFNSGQPVSNPSNTSVIHASSPQQPIAPAYRDAESVADDYLDGVMANISSSKTHGAPQGPTASSNPATQPFARAQPEANKKITMSTILPKHVEATCPLDQILLDFLTSRRLLAAQGTPASALVGPLKPSITGLVNPSYKGPAHAAIRVMADVVSTFKDTRLQEQLGFFYIMYSTMRWQIAPTDETFESLPSWLRPTIFQVVVPHAAWIDNIPWPKIRDLLIQNPTKYTFRDFSEIYASNVNLNWPFDAADAVMPRTESSDELVMNPLFEKHIQKLESWSVSEPFKYRFPEFAAAIEDS